MDPHRPQKPKPPTRKLNLTEEQKYHRMLVALLIGGTLNGHQLRRLADLADDGNGTTGRAWKRLKHGPMIYQFGSGPQTINMLSQSGWKFAVYLVNRNKSLALFAKSMQKALDDAGTAPGRIDRAADAIRRPDHSAVALAFLLKSQPANTQELRVTRRHSAANKTYSRTLEDLAIDGLVDYQPATNDISGRTFWHQYTLTPKGRIQAEAAAESLKGIDVQQLAEATERAEVVVLGPERNPAVLTTRAQRVLIRFLADATPRTSVQIANELGVHSRPLRPVLYELTDLGFLESSGALPLRKSTGATPKPLAITTVGVEVAQQLARMALAAERTPSRETVDLARGLG